MKALNDLSSAKTWSFPPRPWTHHVRWIEPDATNPNILFVAIEAGALVQSRDGGKTWIDRVKYGPYDTHTLATHPKAPKRIYSAAGDGYFESLDYGESWTRPMEGLKHSYLVGLAVDSGNPNTVIVSASDGPFKSFSPNDAKTFVYRKDDEDSKDWKVVSNGLPEPNGTTVSILASNQKIPGSFTPPTIMVSLFQLIRVIHGGNLVQNGKGNIFYKLLSRLLLANSNIIGSVSPVLMVEDFFTHKFSVLSALGFVSDAWPATPFFTCFIVNWS